MPAAPCWFLRLESDSCCRCCWGPLGDQSGKTRATVNPAAPPRRAASGLARINPRSPQSSIHHLAAELATCQPAATCASRRRHLPNPTAVARERVPRRARLGAREQLGALRQVQPLRPRPSDQPSIVVTASALPDRIERHRYDPVAAKRFAFTLHSPAGPSANRSRRRATSSYFSGKIA
jgi:hypothetical protein